MRSFETVEEGGTSVAEGQPESSPEERAATERSEEFEHESSPDVVSRGSTSEDDTVFAAAQKEEDAFRSEAEAIKSASRSRQVERELREQAAELPNSNEEKWSLLTKAEVYRERAEAIETKDERLLAEQRQELAQKEEQLSVLQGKDASAEEVAALREEIGDIRQNIRILEGGEVDLSREEVGVDKGNTETVQESRGSSLRSTDLSDTPKGGHSLEGKNGRSWFSKLFGR